MRTPLFAMAVTFLLLPHCHAQKYTERSMSIDCGDAEKRVKLYLAGRGFTQPECPNCPHKPNSLKSPKELLDAQDKPLGTQRIRRDFSRMKVPFWVWSSPLHARAFLSFKPDSSGCRVGLYIDFYSQHTMVAGIFPVGERLGLPSNGRLESDYLDAITTPETQDR